MEGSNEKNNKLNVRRSVVLPSTHIGSDQYMRQKTHEIIAISNYVGHPGIFIAMACNKYWSEIQSALCQGQRAGDRPDPCDRGFRMKLRLVLNHLKEGEPF